jgi:hypothetical protein
MSLGFPQRSRCLKGLGKCELAGRYLKFEVSTMRLNASCGFPARRGFRTAW